MEETILKIIREGWPVKTEEILHDLEFLHSQGLLDVEVDQPPAEPEVLAIVRQLEEAGRVKSVRAGWEWVAPPPEPVKPVARQRNLLDVCE